MRDEDSYEDSDEYTGVYVTLPIQSPWKVIQIKRGRHPGLVIPGTVKLNVNLNLSCQYYLNNF